MTPRAMRIWISLVWLVTWFPTSVLILILGLLSMRRLGRALETAGRDLQQKYHW